MRRARDLYASIAEHENLLVGFHRARRGKQDRSAVRAFAADLDAEIDGLRRELLAESVQLRGYRYFSIRDPKPRRIAAPAFRDRVLHHAILRVVEPEFERVAIHDSYACRVGKGLHRAVARAWWYARRHRCYLQLDVQKFFDSIDHAVLTRLLARRFKDRRLLRLFETILGSYATAPGKGLPIGSLTSQHLANFYLAALDHFVKEELRVPGYVRYMDDFVLFDDDQDRLRDGRSRIAEFADAQLRLRLKGGGALDRTAGGIGFLGILIRPSHLSLMGRTKRRVRRKLRQLVDAHRRGLVDAETLAVRTTALLVRSRQVRAGGLRRRWIEEFAGIDA